ncbi:MAG: hypothetical protein RR816_09000 [Clostridia bacterium]
MVNKLVTNKSAVSAKYGANQNLFWAQVDRLMAYDRKRGVITELVCVDDAQQMLSIDTPVVTSESNYQQNKVAIDGIFNGYNPHFITILGADDIIPFQQLKNPQDASFIPSDLPYACMKGYSDDIKQFIAPNRMVTRLPDVKGNVTPETLVAFVKTVDAVISSFPDTADQYKSWWNVCTTQRKVAMDCTENYFQSRGVRFDKYISPSDGPDWRMAVYGKRVHHHIVHGSQYENVLYGESFPPTTYPNAVEALKVKDKVKTGTVVLEIACYGAQLYDPANGKSGTHGLPIANMYLSSGAVGMIGSTISTYSSLSGMACSDYMASYFMEAVLDKKTFAEALLLARQRLLMRYTTLDAIAQITLAEFLVYGYPSSNVVKTDRGDEILEEPNRDMHRSTAEQLGQSIRYAVHRPELRPSAQSEQYIRDFLAQKGVDDMIPLKGYAIEGGSPSLARDPIIHQYLATVARGRFDFSLYLFTESDGRIIEKKEYAQN